MDYDRVSSNNIRGVPCRVCEVTVVAADPNPTAPHAWVRKGPVTADKTVEVRITVTAVEDSISTPHITKANPVPGVGMGKDESALAGLKAKSGVAGAPPESPSDLPATYGDSGKAPANYVETEWANWGTVLRIEVTAESPDDKCGNGKQQPVCRIDCYE